MDKDYVLALDQGTTSSRAILFDRVRHRASVRPSGSSHQIYPAPRLGRARPHGDLGHPERAWPGKCSRSWASSPQQVAAIGITNQRETTVVWDRATGRPIHNAIVWQCRRTAGICDELKARGLEPMIRERTGLVLDAYFSGTKLKWILDHVRRAPGSGPREGELLFGTVDTWLIWNLTRGAVHATDYSNASRTMLFNIQELRWDPEILAALDIPAAHAAGGQALQRRSSATPTAQTFGGAAIPIAGRRRRPAGRPVRPGLLLPGHGQEHLRHRLLPAHEHRRPAGRAQPRPAHHHRLGGGRPGGLCPGRQHLRGRARPCSGCATS